MKLCPACAFIPLPHGQEDDRLDRHNEEESRHDSHRAVHRVFCLWLLYARGSGRTRVIVAIVQRFMEHMCTKRHSGAGR
jgi:hypothetical protein